MDCGSTPTNVGKRPTELFRIGRYAPGGFPIFTRMKVKMTKSSLRAANAIVPDTASPNVGERPLAAIEMSQIVLGVGAGLLLLHWSKDFFAPLLFGILVSYALRLPVNVLERKRLPRALASTVGLHGCSRTQMHFTIRPKTRSFLDQCYIRLGGAIKMFFDRCR